MTDIDSNANEEAGGDDLDKTILALAEGNAELFEALIGDPKTIYPLMRANHNSPEKVSFELGLQLDEMDGKYSLQLLADEYFSDGINSDLVTGLNKFFDYICNQYDSQKWLILFNLIQAWEISAARIDQSEATEVHEKFSEAVQADPEQREELLKSLPGSFAGDLMDTARYFRFLTYQKFMDEFDAIPTPFADYSAIRTMLLEINVPSSLASTLAHHRAIVGSENFLKTLKQKSADVSPPAPGSNIDTPGPRP